MEEASAKEGGKLETVGAPKSNPVEYTDAILGDEIFQMYVSSVPAGRAHKDFHGHLN